MDLPATGGRWSRDPTTGAIIRIDEESGAATPPETPAPPAAPDTGSTSPDEEH